MTQTEKTITSTAIGNQVHKIFPNDLNSNRTVFGGLVMSQLDRIASVVAECHSASTCVTASVDALHFLAPAREGEVLSISASVNRSWTSSMEIGVRVEARNQRTGTKAHIVSAYFTFVALNEKGTPIQVPKAIPETQEQIRRYEDAGIRRENRKKDALERKHRHAKHQENIINPS